MPSATQPQEQATPSTDALSAFTEAILTAPVGAPAPDPDMLPSDSRTSRILGEDVYTPETPQETPEASPGEPSSQEPPAEPQEATPSNLERLTEQVSQLTSLVSARTQREADRLSGEAPPTQTDQLIDFVGDTPSDDLYTPEGYNKTLNAAYRRARADAFQDLVQQQESNASRQKAAMQLVDAFWQTNGTFLAELKTNPSLAEEFSEHSRWYQHQHAPEIAKAQKADLGKHFSAIVQSFQQKRKVLGDFNPGGSQPQTQGAAPTPARTRTSVPKRVANTRNVDDVIQKACEQMGINPLKFTAGFQER